jgi:hypothetical protein
VAAERALVGSSLAIHAISEAIGGTIRSEYGAPAGSVTVVPIALPDLVDDAAEASEPSPAGDDVRSPVRILFVGRLEPRKGLDALLAAAAEIVGERSDVEFDLAGDDSIVVAGGETYRARFERDLGDREQSARVRFHGVVDERRLDELYRSCDVFVAPSRYESFGLVFLEAMQRGKPVVGTRVGGVPEVVRDLVDGLLVDPDDPAALRSAILTLVDDADRRAAMGESGRMRVRGELSLDRYVAGLEALFARIRQIGPDAAIEVTGDVDDVIVDGRPALALGAAGRVVVALPPCAARRVAVVVSDGPATVRVGRGGSARDVLLGEAGVHRLDIGSGDVVDGTVELARRDEGEGACTVVAIHVLEEVPPCASPS